MTLELVVNRTARPAEHLTWLFSPFVNPLYFTVGVGCIDQFSDEVEVRCLGENIFYVLRSLGENACGYESRCNNCDKTFHFKGYLIRPLI